MTAENRALLDAIRIIVREELTPLNEKIDVLGERVGRLERVVEQLDQRVSLLENRFDRLDARTSQIAQDLVELRDRVDRGFSSLKRETMLALGEIAEVKRSRKADQKRLKELEDIIMDLQRRIAALERGRDQQSS